MNHAAPLAERADAPSAARSELSPAPDAEILSGPMGAALLDVQELHELPAAVPAGFSPRGEITMPQEARFD